MTIKSKIATLNVYPLVSRPSAGNLLFAHTMAILALFGFGPKVNVTVNRRTLSRLWGERAVSYHLQNGNLEAVKGDRVRLTAQGKSKFFSERTGRYTEQAKADYLAAIRDGKASDNVKESNIDKPITLEI